MEQKLQWIQIHGLVSQLNYMQFYTSLTCLLVFVLKKVEQQVNYFLSLEP